MVLNVVQRTLFQKARAPGGGDQAVGLDDAACRALILLVARDLDRAAAFPDIPDVPDLYAADPPDVLRVEAPVEPLEMFERLLEACGQDAGMYFSSLASLLKARLKYRKILSTQPISTIDQGGPRSLLEYGLLPTSSLAALLFWRKWVFDIDNRSGQETGYLFEPIIANSIGGTPVPAKRSPVRRRSGTGGRQIDCLRGTDAYELKLRVTIAASGQGRWGEELAFPEECKASGYKPVLVVFDPTANPKLSELAMAFEVAGGDVHIGANAWSHLEQAAGTTMSVFLDKYVRRPLQDLLGSVQTELPELTMKLDAEHVVFALGNRSYEVTRARPDMDLLEGGDELPDDVQETLPGV